MSKLSLIIIVLPFLSFAQQTYVPDHYFETFLESNGMGNGVFDDNYVTTANIASVTYLNINNQNITDETGIEDFVSLTSLHCAGNWFNSLTLNSPNLDTMICAYNFLSYLDLSQCIDLRYLECQGNNMGSMLDLSANLELTFLNCSGNQTDSLDVSQNQKLEYLNSAANPMTYLNVTGVDSLTYLNCKYCWLPNVDLSTNLKLAYLNLFNTEITALDITNNTELTHIDVEINELTALDVSQNVLLDTLSCSENNLLSLNVTNNPALTLLRCSSNNLTDLDISQNSDLEYIECAANQLTELVASYNSKLLYLNCVGNDLYCLNLKNGNNPIIFNINPNNNPNLTCIEVDDPVFSAATWAPFGGLDPQMSYSTDCSNSCTLDYEELTSDPKQLVRIIDLMGRETDEKTNSSLIYIYSDGSMEKVFLLE